MEGVLLDARPVRGGLELTIAGNEGPLTVRVEASYRAYLLPLNGLEAERLAGGLEGFNAWVEEWLRPPWYDEPVDVVVASSPDPKALETAVSRLESRGVARRVNAYPGPLVEALWRLGVPPGVRVRVSSRGLEALEDPGDPLYEPPPLRVARVEAFSWHGELAVPWEEPDYYIVECSGRGERLGDPRLVVEALEECRPHIVVGRLEARYTLPEEGGWLWFDPERNLVGVWGLLEWMRVSWLPFHMANQAPIGKILTAAEAREAYGRRYLVDPGAPRMEPFRPVRELARADLAGAARIPAAGLYWRVYQLDYSSLYPSLIAKHNISSETVYRPNCQEYEEAPGVGHRICLDTPGLVSTVLARLVERRGILKREAPRDPRAAERADALKWILVSGFGYLGYRNSLFGSITAYESVTAYARRALAVAEEEAERAGYRLVHSIIDSVFIQPVDPRLDPWELAERIEARVGVPLRLEAEYKWLYIPGTLRGPGAVNKYYGALPDGGVKMKGVIAVRRDTPPFIASVQARAIRVLAGAGSPGEFHEAVCRAHEVLDGALGEILSGRVPPEALVMTRRLSYPSQRPQSYRKRLDEMGLVLDRVRYLVTPRGPRPVWELGPGARYDPRYYSRVLGWARRELPPRWCSSS